MPLKFFTSTVISSRAAVAGRSPADRCGTRQADPTVTLRLPISAASGLSAAGLLWVVFGAGFADAGPSSGTAVSVPPRARGVLSPAQSERSVGLPQFPTTRSCRWSCLATGRLAGPSRSLRIQEMPINAAARTTENTRPMMSFCCCCRRLWRMRAASPSAGEGEGERGRGGDEPVMAGNGISPSPLANGGGTGRPSDVGRMATGGANHRDCGCDTRFRDALGNG